MGKGIKLRATVQAAGTKPVASEWSMILSAKAFLVGWMKRVTESSLSAASIGRHGWAWSMELLWLIHD